MGLTYDKETEQYKIETPTITFLISEEEKEYNTMKEIESKVKILEENYIANKEKIYQYILDEIKEHYKDLTIDNIEEKLGKPYFELFNENLIFNRHKLDEHTIFIEIYETFDEIGLVSLFG